MTNGWWQRWGGPATALAGVLCVLFVSAPGHAADWRRDLGGTWKFKAADHAAFAAADHDDSDWIEIPVPGMWRTAGIEHDGVAWYRRTIALTAEQAADVVIRPPAIIFAYEMFVNGRLVCGQGEISDAGRLRERGVGLEPCHLPPGLAVAGSNLIAVRVHSDYGVGGFEFTGFWIGDARTIAETQAQYYVHYGAIAAALAMFGIYHLVLFIGRSEPAYLYLSVLSLALTCYVVGIKGLVLPWIDSFWLSFELFYAAIALAPWGVSGFFHALYDLPGGWIKRAATPLTVANLVVLATLPASEFVRQYIYPAWVPVTSVMAVLYSVYGVVLTAKAVRLGRFGARLALGGFAAMALTICHDILIRRGILHAATIAEDGYLLWMVTLASAMALKVAKLHNDTDSLNVELARAVDRITNTAQAIRRFVPDPFLQLLHRTDLTEVRAGDSTLQEMTVMFADIRGFTSLAERLDAAETFALLNRYLAGVAPAIETHGGFIDKYLGDGIMALFGDTANAPGAGSVQGDGLQTLADPAARVADEAGNSAVRALAAAIAMRRALDDLRRRLPAASALDIGAGLHSGRLMLGTVGSATRLDTTAIGDTVNLAARIEALNRMYGARLLLSQQTYDMLPPQARTGIREIDLVRVVGARTPVRIFEVIEVDEPHLRAQKVAGREPFAAGLAAFRRGDFDTARDAFVAAALKAPNDAVAALYVERCASYKKTTPAQWTGVVDLQQK